MVFPSGVEGQNGLSVGGRRTPRDAQHPRLRWAVNVSVEQSDPLPLCRECERDVRGHRRFADAAFAGPHGDDAINALNRAGIAGGWDGLVARFRAAQIRRRSFVEWRVRGWGRRCAARFRRMCGQDDRHRRNPINGFRGVFCGLAQRLQSGSALWVNFQSKTNRAALDHEALHHVRGDDIRTLGGIGDFRQGREHGLFQRIRHLRPRQVN